MQKPCQKLIFSIDLQITCHYRYVMGSDEKVIDDD